MVCGVPKADYKNSPLRRRKTCVNPKRLAYQAENKPKAIMLFTGKRPDGKTGTNQYSYLADVYYCFIHGN
jgi:hypothetical protein